MAMSGGKDDGQPMMEMNTTPLIDVMLVLLIMFIITIPPITHAVDIDLPVDSNEPKEPPLVDPIVNKIFIEENNQVLWNGEPVTLDQVESYLNQTKAMEVLSFRRDECAVHAFFLQAKHHDDIGVFQAHRHVMINFDPPFGSAGRQQRGRTNQTNATFHFSKQVDV